MSIVAKTTSTIDLSPTPQAVAVGPGYVTFTPHEVGCRFAFQNTGQTADTDAGHVGQKHFNHSHFLETGESLLLWGQGKAAVTAEVAP